MIAHKRPELLTCALILGMHRSGTSCLTGVLQRAGLYLGEVHTQNPFNAKGNREHPDAMRLNEALLQAQSGSWDQPCLANLPGPELQASMSHFLKTLAAGAQAQPFGFKDPRLVFTLPAWQPLLRSQHTVYLASFRHPLAVALSLQARNNFDLDRGLALWESYNRQLLQWADRLPVHFVDFDQPSNAYQQRIAQLLPHLGLSSSAASQGLEFYTESLRHQRVPPEAKLPQSAASLYAQLRQRACS